MRVISKEEMQRRTRRLLDAIPQSKRDVVAEEIRRYVELRGSLAKCLGEGADVVLRKMNKANFDWDRSLADRVEARERNRERNQPWAAPDPARDEDVKGPCWNGEGPLNGNGPAWLSFWERRSWS